MAPISLIRPRGRSLRGNVDRNNVGELIPFDVIEGRSLRGNVDRNAVTFRCCFAGCASFPTWERG